MTQAKALSYIPERAGSPALLPADGACLLCASDPHSGPRRPMADAPFLLALTSAARDKFVAQSAANTTGSADDVCCDISNAGRFILRVGLWECSGKGKGCFRQRAVLVGGNVDSA